MTVIGNLSRAGGKTATDHAVSSAGWLSGAVAKQTEAEDIQRRHHHRSGAREADRPGHAVPVARVRHRGFLRLHRRLRARLQLHLHEHDLVGRARRTPLPMEINPRVAFERLFGRAGDAGAARWRACARTAASSTRSPRRRASCSGGSARRTARGSSDYLDNVREIERRIQRTEAQQRRERDGGRRAGRHSRVVRGARGADVRPAGGGLPGRPDARLHVHDGARGEPADVSRRSASPSRTTTCRITATQRRQDGAAREDQHALHAQLFATFVEKLQATPEGDGSRARPLADRVRHRHERRPGAQRLSAAARRWSAAPAAAQGQPLHRRARVDADRQPLAQRRRHVRQPLETFGESTGRVEL